MNICTAVTTPSAKQHSVRGTQQSHKRCTGNINIFEATVEHAVHARTCQSKAAHLGCEHVDHAIASTANPSLNAAPHHTAEELEEIRLRENQATATASLASLATPFSPPQHALKHAEALKYPLAGHG